MSIMTPFHKKGTRYPVYLPRATCVTLKQPTEKVFWCLYALFVNGTEGIKKNCNCEVKPQTHNVAYNLNSNLWAISALATEQLQIRCLQKTYHVSVKIPFQLIFLPSAYQAFSRNIYIPTTVELTNIVQNVILHKRFLGFN